MSELLFPNGIDADTGGSLDGDLPITTEMIASVARGNRITKEELDDARRRKALDQRKEADFGVVEGIDETDTGSSGWSVVFPASLPQKSTDAIKDALKPLLELRREQASKQKEKYYREILGENGYRNGESKNDFLKRFGRGPGPADPEFYPYYCMIVGSPETIPFTFQYQLDVQYAVGRIYFDKLEDYYLYASSVVAAENKKVARTRSAAFFGVSNTDDVATSMSATSLIQPLASRIKDQHGDWAVDLINPTDTTKSNLANYLGGAKTPAMLFTASHGMGFKPGDPRQLRHSGALVTQDWPGPKAHLPVTEGMYFSADDIAADADVFGLMAFIFACYGGGSPKSDNFYRQAFGQQKDIAPYTFLSQLPQRLLAHPKGGALGVFAHVDRAWGSSIRWDGAVNDFETFNSTVAALMNGKPAGAATEAFNSRYAEISTMLTEELDMTTPEMQDDVKLAGLWTSNNDSRNYTFIGDPAVRLAVVNSVQEQQQHEHLGNINLGIPASLLDAAQNFVSDVADHSRVIQPANSSAQAETNYNIITDAIKRAVDPSDSSVNRNENSDVETRLKVKETQENNTSLKTYIEKLGSYLSRMVDEAVSLEVTTYVAGDLEKVVYDRDSGRLSGAELRAFTHINLNGNTQVVVPEKDGELDLAVWSIHTDMVRNAQANRAELMKIVVNAASSIAGIIK